ncbi:peptidoglycan-binding protein [Staphylococcus phage Maine]|nr:peptidoglycan-binding protein [Staphylococcus phage Maine]
MNNLIKEGNKYYHKVRAGETLWTISKNYDVEIKKLQELNNIKSVSLTNLEYVLVCVE